MLATSAPSTDFASALADSINPPKPEPVTLGQAARDPGAIGGCVPWWPAQLDLLDSLDTDIQTHIWALGRQAGKTSMAAAASIHNAAMRPDLDSILPRGRVRYILVAGAGQDQSFEFIRVCKGMLAQLPELEALTTQWTARIEFDLGHGRVSCIRAMPTWARSVRGLSASLVVLDEFAHVAQTAGPGADVQLYSAITPALRAFGARAKVLAISTPSGRTGKFYELFEEAAGGVLPSARAVQGTVHEIVPNIDQGWLDAQRAELGESLYAQEYEANFNEAGGAFFDLSQIEFADSEAYVEEGTDWVAAVDPAFHADSFGYALIGHSRAEPGRLLVGPVGAIRPEGEARSFDARRGREDATLEQVYSLIAPYAPVKLLGDQHQASAIQSFFGRRGIPCEIVNVTGTIQTASFVTLRARLVDGSVRCPRVPLLLEELRRVRAKEGEKVYLPRFGDSHCDAVVALALAVWTAEGTGLPPSLASGPAPRAYRTRKYGASEFS